MMNKLPAWERLFKRLLWEQLGEVKGKRILDLGSGAGVTANYLAQWNDVVAVEPSEAMLRNRWQDHPYEQRVGDASLLTEFADGSFDMVLVHNVLEYIENQLPVIDELHRVLRSGGSLSLVKHNRAGRVMQMAVLLDDLERAHDLLDGKKGMTADFGAIHYMDGDLVARRQAGFRVAEHYGIRSFWHLQQRQEKHDDEAWQEAMMALERRVQEIPTYRDIAFFHHLIYVKDD